MIDSRSRMGPLVTSTGADMQFKVVPHNGGYDLLLDGKLAIEQESMQVIDNVIESMKRGGSGTTEAAEVARSILRTVRRQ